MNLVLDIRTSIGFWRRIYPLNRAPKQPVSQHISSCAFKKKDVLRLAPVWADSSFLALDDGLLHAMTFNPDERRRSQSHKTHVWNSPLPDGSFYRLNETVYIASPAFIFLAAASILSMHALIAFGCELCGYYSFDPREERGFRIRTVPLSTPDQLRALLQRASHCSGHKRALAALSYVIAFSASPMETFDAMALYLPYHLGGYCFDPPLMNHKVKLSGKAARIAQRNTCYADICYLKKRDSGVKIDIEHHGKHDHSREEDKAFDRARVNGLKEMGFEVVELTIDQVNDIAAFEYIVLRIARLLGKRVRSEGRGATPARLKLRKEVFAWNRSYGCLERQPR